ncbi:MAG: PAS domain S-box protein [Deltaproteobacteria bacterium]|nr:PAS domain S-box protein [Deltaproteobacteria bacterium]
MNQSSDSATAPPQPAVRHGVWLALAVLLVCLIATAIGAFYMKATVEALAKRQFAFACDEIRARINDRLDNHEHILRSGAAFFDALDTVTREKWRTFIKRLHVEGQCPGIQGVGFALLIPSERLAQHIQEIRLEGFPNYRLWPDGERDIYTSIIYLEPFSGRNLRAFGYDMFSESVRRSAMEQSRDHDTAALTRKVRLVQETETDVQTGTLMYVPVYRRGMPTDTVEQRRAALQGWVYSPYRMNDLMHGILGGWTLHEGKSIRLQVYDGESLSHDTLLYDSKATGSKAFEPQSMVTMQALINFKGRTWTLHFSQEGGGLFSIEYSRVWLILAGGMAISFLLFSLIRSLINTSFNARKIANQLTVELRESEEFTKDIIDSLQDIICVLDLKGNIISVNKSWQQFAIENGATMPYIGAQYLAFCKESIGRVDDEGAQAAFIGISAVLNGEQQFFSLEYPCHSPDNHRWFQMNVAVMRGHRGGLVISHSNISDRKQAEESAAALAIRNQTLLRNAGDGIHVLDEQGNVVEANDAFCNMLGYSREEILQLNVADWDVQWSREELVEKIRELITFNAVFETRHRRKDGHIRNVEISGVGVLLQGRSYLYASARDLTERRQSEAALRESEEKYRVLFHNELYAIYILDLETSKFLDVNDAYVKLYGYSRDELMGGMTIHDITVQHQESDSTIQQILSEGTIYIPMRFHKRKDGIVFPVEIVGGPYTWQGRKVMFGLARDISQRQRAEEAALEAHKRLDEIIEFFPDATFVIDTNGHVTHWNRAIEKMTGVLKADMLHKGEYEYALPFYGDRRPLLIDVALSIASYPELQIEEYDLIQREGDSFLGESFVPEVFEGKGAYLSATSSVLRDSLGNVTGGIESIRDITERKRIEEALRESEGRYRSMFEKNRAVMLLIEPGTGLLVDANPAACNFYGYTRDQFLTMRITDINMLPREQVQTEMELARAERRNYFIFCHRVATGDIRDVEVHSGPIEIKGRTLLYSIIHDITDRRQAEKALQDSKRAYDEMVARVPVGIYKFRMMSEGHMVFDYVSPRWCEILDLQCEDALRDSKVAFDLVHPEEIQHFVEANEEARKKLELFLWEGRFVIKDHVRFMHIESLPKRLENGDIVWTGTVQDITDEKRADAERAELEHRLQQAQKAESLGRMAGSIAHNFNNMLGVVIGNLELAMDELLEGTDSHTCIAQAMKASRKAAEISRFMLTYLGQAVGKKRAIDLSEAVEEAEGFICSSMPVNVHLKSDLPSQGPIIQADAVDIKQILTNLVSNAVEAIGKAEGHITLTVGVVTSDKIRNSKFFPIDWTPKEKCYSCLSVIDTGPGLDDAIIEKIFDPFFTTRFTGRGLGLSVVLGLVRACEGAITVESRPAQGAMFRVYFPMPESKEQPHSD